MGAGARRQPQRRLVSALAGELGADPTDALAALDEAWRA